MKRPFDIFAFLKISRREDVLHTPMLAGLLDPLREHGLGRTFLGEFLGILSCTDLPLCRKDAFQNEWIVEQEHGVGDGEIDLLLLCPAKKIAIAIENKIDSNESPTQLRCYLKWLRTLSPDFNTRLFLLTPKGKPARGVAENECVSISYAHMFVALQKCLIKSGSLRFVKKHAHTLAEEILKIDPSAVDKGLIAPTRSNINLFRFLRISRREDVLHTRMLAGLFDPKETHGQKTLFLAPFLKLVLGSRFESSDLGCEWEVKAEHRTTNHGTLDILLRCKKGGILIVIENKIDAGEENDQLNRYSEWMATQRKEFRQQALIFLTPDGREAVSASKTPYQRLSYQQILNMLTSRATQVKDAAFKEALNDYWEIVEGLVPQAGNSNRSPLDRRLIPDKTHADAAWAFHCNLVEQWKRLPVPAFLTAMPSEDTKYKGKYHGTEIWHEDMDSPKAQPILVMRVETNLANKRFTGLWIGFHWKNPQDRKFEKHSKVLELQGFCERLYKKIPCSDMKKGCWFAFALQIEDISTDGGLVSALRCHEQDIQQTIALRVRSLWLLWGNMFLEINKLALGAA